MNDPEPVNMLSRCRALADVPGDILDIVRERCSRRSFGAGEVLMRQGAEGESLLVLVDGTAVASVKDANGRQTRVGEFGPYDVIGEMAILTSEPRTADVVARSSGSALELSTDHFRQLAGDHPELGLVLTHIVADRLGEQSADGMGGKLVGGYRIDHCIGRGGMAIVYRAEHVTSQRAVALKMMSHRLIYERGAMARFQREADILFSLEHPNITRVFERFSAFKTCFIAMELCDGSDLAALIRGGYRPDDADLRRIIGQLAAGLGYLHSRGVVHRDLKPQNALVSRDGIVRLADFGLARNAVQQPEQALTIPGSLLGTPYYMAPEQLDGAEVSPGTDVYALGCLILELITGVPPFAGNNLYEIARKKRSLALPPRRQLGRRISRGIYGLVKACLAPDPEKRKVDLARLSRWSQPISTTWDGIASR